MADGMEITGHVVNLNIVMVCIVKAYVLIFRTLLMLTFMRFNVLIILWSFVLKGMCL